MINASSRNCNLRQGENMGSNTEARIRLSSDLAYTGSQQGYLLVERLVVDRAPLGHTLLRVCKVIDI